MTNLLFKELMKHFNSVKNDFQNCLRESQSDLNLASFKSLTEDLTLAKNQLYSIRNLFTAHGRNVHQIEELFETLETDLFSSLRTLL